MKSILFITGTRADFGKIKPLILKIQDSEAISYSIFATGMHTQKQYGLTIHEIEKAGLKNIYPYINQNPGSTTMDTTLAATIEGISRYVHQYTPDMIIVHGDRVEALAGAIVGSLNNILVAHIEGGEISGTIDETLRHAVTKLSHIHFVANDEAKSRIIQMGEAESSIFVIGSPDIDVMLSDTLPSLDEAKKYYLIDFENYGILLYHPVTTELKNISDNVSAIINALKKIKLNIIIVYPNNDPGSEIILNALLTLAKEPEYRIFPSIRFEYFLTFLKNSRVIIGNSSAGIREAPIYGIPTINIGTRQYNRFNCSSIYNVSNNSEAIIDTYNQLPIRCPISFHFGRGNSADRFFEIIHQEHVWNISYQKHFFDRNF